MLTVHGGVLFVLLLKSAQFVLEDFIYMMENVKMSVQLEHIILGPISNAKYAHLIIVLLVMRVPVIDVKMELIFIMEVVQALAQMALMSLIIILDQNVELAQCNVKLVVIIIPVRLVKMDILLKEDSV